jgi:hypothetical protein
VEKYCAVAGLCGRGGGIAEATCGAGVAGVAGHDAGLFGVWGTEPCHCGCDCGFTGGGEYGGGGRCTWAGEGAVAVGAP